jgi:tRNA isopentenyl-2-thiomethyl-A-37 hydroxylase MiaE
MRKGLIVEKTYEWCVNKFGSPLKSGAVPDLEVSKNYRFKEAQGEYSERLITIYAHNCKSISGLIRVVIHEYTHFLQMPKMNDMSKYEKLSKKFSYETHPMEVEAYESELKHFRNCLKYLQRRNVI